MPAGSPEELTQVAQLEAEMRVASTVLAQRQRGIVDVGGDEHLGCGELSAAYCLSKLHIHQI